MEIRQLECFTKTAELGSFTRAAAELHISQPALSRSIHLLEEGLDTQLFDRQGKKVTLNPTGREVLEHTREILRHCHEIKALCRENKRKEENTVTLRMLAASEELPEILTEFHQSFPEVSIISLQSKNDGQEAADICVYASVERKKARYDRTVMEERIALAAPPGHPLYSEKAVSLEEVAGCPIISLRSGNDMRDIEDCYFQRRGLTPQREIECDTPATLRALLKKGVGIALVPTRTWESITRSQLRLVPLKERECVRYINCALTDPGSASVSTLALYEHILEHFGNVCK